MDVSVHSDCTNSFSGWHFACDHEIGECTRCRAWHPHHAMNKNFAFCVKEKKTFQQNSHRLFRTFFYLHCWGHSQWTLMRYRSSVRCLLLAYQLRESPYICKKGWWTFQEFKENSMNDNGKWFGKKLSNLPEIFTVYVHVRWWWVFLWWRDKRKDKG